MNSPDHASGWWMASDSKWYPPELHPSAPTAADAPGADISEVTRPGSSFTAIAPSDSAPEEGLEAYGDDDLGAPLPGWWVASDGKWYPPELHPDARDRLAEETAPVTVHAQVAGGEEIAAEPPEGEATTSPGPALPPQHRERVAFSTSDWVPGGPFGVDVNGAHRQEVQVGPAFKRFLQAPSATRSGRDAPAWSNSNVDSRLKQPSKRRSRRG